MVRPSFSDLTPAQQLNFGNGIGPDWFPGWLRNFITGIMSWFFSDASWRHHDFGYVMGHSEAHRWEYDWKFFKAMLKDAVSQDSFLLIIPAILMSVFFYKSVLLFGWLSFHYGWWYRTIDEILLEY